MLLYSSWKSKAWKYFTFGDNSHTYVVAASCLRNTDNWEMWHFFVSIVATNITLVSDCDISIGSLNHLNTLLNTSNAIFCLFKISKISQISNILRHVSVCVLLFKNNVRSFKHVPNPTQCDAALFNITSFTIKIKKVKLLHTFGVRWSSLKEGRKVLWAADWRKISSAGQRLGNKAIIATYLIQYDSISSLRCL